MIDNSNAAAQRSATLARFPLSRVTEAFHDDMLGVLPPGQIVGMPGFFVSEAVTGDIHAQFVRCNGRFYGGYIALGYPATWITHARIVAFDAAHPNAEELGTGGGRMTRYRILELGAGPTNEPCAQLGCTPDFAEANTLELLTYKAAIIAVNGEPPLPLGFALVTNAHDFGAYRTLWLVSAELPLPAAAQAWIDAGFPSPVTYEGAQATLRPFREVIAGALQITRPRDDGSFFPPQNAVLHRNLLAAYGPNSDDGSAGGG